MTSMFFFLLVGKGLYCSVTFTSFRSQYHQFHNLSFSIIWAYQYISLTRIIIEQNCSYIESTMFYCQKHDWLKSLKCAKLKALCNAKGGKYFYESFLIHSYYISLDCLKKNGTHKIRSSSWRGYDQRTNTVQTMNHLLLSFDWRVYYWSIYQLLPNFLENLDFFTLCRRPLTNLLLYLFSRSWLILFTFELFSHGHSHKIIIIKRKFILTI